MDLSALIPALSGVEAFAAFLLIPFSLWIVISGLDDLFVDIVFLRSCRRRESTGSLPAPPAEPQKHLAIFVPCWREDPVIRDMVEHNVAALRYKNYEFFLGAYPNDAPTQRAIEELAKRFPFVHLALTPHDGPTSKADCLNWIYQRMVLHEETSGTRFDGVVIHDAEDIIHPDSLAIISHHIETYDMVQVPVLPLKTPVREFTHGVYCDDFAEYLTRDMPVRVHLGGFMPSNGVGTGFSRFALERVASADANRLFEPACLTEDYEIGFRLRMLSCLQLFVPVRFRDGAPVATRALFPTRFRPAVRQRTRWVTGIALQGWQRHGWQGGIRQGYWHWRDRKGLVGNTVSLAANLISLWGLLSWSVSRLNGSAWTFGERVPPAVIALLPLSLFFLMWRTAFKIACTRRVYGTPFAICAPLRVLWANWVNGVATFSAIHRFSVAWLRHEPLVWLKTEHRYPSKAALSEHKRPLGEILVMSHYITQGQLEQAQSTKPSGIRIGEHLVALGHLTEEELYEALSLQQSLPTVALDPAEVPKRVARSLPAHVVKKWQVLPFRIESGNIFLASPEVPSDEAELDVRRFTRLEVRFQLITPSNFRELQQQLLETSASGYLPPRYH